MDDRVRLGVPSPPSPPSPPPRSDNSDKLKPLFTHEPLSLSRQEAPKQDTRHSQDITLSETPTLHPSRRSRPTTNTNTVPVSASVLVQPGVEGSTTQNRPSNSWLRYRRLKQVELAHLGLKMGELSKVIAKMWKEEPQETKDFHKARCQEQWASDRANGYQYRQPKMPLPGEPRAKKGRSGPWRKTQRPLLDAGNVPSEDAGQLNPSSVPPHVLVGDMGAEDIAEPETNSAIRATLSGNPHGRGSRGSPNAGPSRPVSIPEVALHQNQTRSLHPSTTPSSSRRADYLSSSTSSSLFRPDDGFSPTLPPAEHKYEPADFEFSPPHSEDDMDVDLGIPLAPIVTSAAQSPLSDTASSPVIAAITLPSLRQDPILGRALELPPVHDYFTVCSAMNGRGEPGLTFTQQSPPQHGASHHHRPSDSRPSPPSNRSFLASRPFSVLPRLRTALFTPSASPPPHTPWDDERPILQHLVTQPAAFHPYFKSHTMAGPSSAHPDTRPPALPISSRHQRVMSYPGALEASSSGGSVLRTPPKIAAATLTARPYPSQGQSPPAPRRRHASPLSDLRPIPPLHSTSPSHSRPQSQTESEDELRALALRLRSEGEPRSDIQMMLRTVSPVPGLLKVSRPMQNQDPSTQVLRSSWGSQHGHPRGSQMYGPLYPLPSQSHQTDQDRTGNDLGKVKRSRKVAQGAGDKEMRFLHTFSRDVWNTVDDGSAGVSLPLPVVDWPNALEPTGGRSALTRGHDVMLASTSPVGAMRAGVDPEGPMSDQFSRDPLCRSLHAKEPVGYSKGALEKGQGHGVGDELEESEGAQDIWVGDTVARGQMPFSDSSGVHKLESPSPSSRVRTWAQSTDVHTSDELKSGPQPLHPTKAEEGMRPEMPIHGSRKYGRMQDHTFRVAPLRPIELPSYCDPPATTSQAPSSSEAHTVGPPLQEDIQSSAPANPPSSSTELQIERSTGTSPTGEQMYWMFDTSGKTFVGYDGRIPHRTRGQRGRPRGRPRGVGRGSRSSLDGVEADVAMRMPNEYVSIDLVFMIIEGMLVITSIHRL